MRKRQETRLRVKESLAPKKASVVTYICLILLSPLFISVKLGQFVQKIFSILVKSAGFVRAIIVPKLALVLRYKPGKDFGKKMSAPLKRNIRELLKLPSKIPTWDFYTAKPFVPLQDITLFNPFHKKRGRPRKRSLLPFYIEKIRRNFNRFIPSSVRLQVLLSIAAFMVLAYSLVVIRAAITLPSPYQLVSTERPLTTQVLDRNGKLLYQFYEGRNRKLIQLDDLPPHLIQATVAIEDKHFFTHPGIDPVGIARALRINMRGGKLEGGSTITQQLVKNTLLTPDKTIKRKIKEAFLAFWAERIYSKKQILQMYFNESPYGGPVWGIETAAEMYFGKSAKGLNLAESSFLAGLPAAPTAYSPYGVHPERGQERQKEVLRRMVEDGYITQAQAEEAAAIELSFRSPVQNIKAPHFVMYVRSVLAEKYGEKAVSQGGLKVITTLDLDMQEMAERVVSDQILGLKNLNVGNGAAMVTNAKNGEILAMVGSKNYFEKEGGNFNVALALRQPGSSIKPITYAAGFKAGYNPGTVLLDTPTSFPNPWGKPYAPVNYDGAFHGPVSIRTALGSSYNIPAVKMLAMVGIPEMLKTAKDMGITTLNDTENYGLSLTLGGGGVKLLEMMTVYGTLASGGVRYDANPILEVSDATGNVLENNREINGRRVLTEEVAYLLSDILADNRARTPAFGPSSMLKIAGHDAAVKTGTSDDKRDNWTFGYTTEYVVGSWVGNSDNSPMHPHLASGVTGAAPIWHDIMVNILADRPNIAFRRPAGIIEATTEGRKDLAINGQTPKKIVGYKTVKQKDDSTGEEKELLVISDQFSSFTSTKSAQVIPTQTTH